MGSKRLMLQNGLGDLLRSECVGATRFVDLFAGSGAVSCFVATHMAMPVQASDIQKYSVILTRSVISRDRPLDAEHFWERWFAAALKVRQTIRIRKTRKGTRADVEELRVWSDSRDGWPITKAYGGHYFSPLQAIWIDSLRQTIPKAEPFHSVALAALISASSRCAAAPGHTAQPFQPTRRGKKYLKHAWSNDIPAHAKKALTVIAPQHAIQKGIARVAEANVAASKLKANDLVFIDPPYSGVQYSRFYHVLESIAMGKTGPVCGIGRYPARSLRPRSNFSMKTLSLAAMQELLEIIAHRKAKAIVTFPEHYCSNGLSGKLIREAAEQHFEVRTMSIASRFSTLGGTGRPAKAGKCREARQPAMELVLTLTPRS